MKKLIIILTALLFISCEKESDCECTGKFKLAGQPNYFYIEKLPIDCDTKQPLKKDFPANYYFSGCK